MFQMPDEGNSVDLEAVSVYQSVPAAAADVPGHARSHVDIETRAQGQENADQGVYILSATGSLDDLIQREDTPSHSPPADGGSNGGSFNEHPPKGDFDDGANALWSLYGTEARGHDQSRIQTLKGDMDGVLIFASSYSYFHICHILIRHHIGWSIFCFAYCVHHQ
jgi:hypothetical protein